VIRLICVDILSTLFVGFLSTFYVDALSTLRVDELTTGRIIRPVKLFRKTLSILISHPPFLGNQRAFAQHTGVDRSLLHHILSKDADKKRRATPVLVGRLCATLPPTEAALLLQAYLSDVVSEISEAEPLPPTSKEEKAKRAPWHQPLRDLDVRIECRAQGGTAL